jgi:hypothetical protein
LFPSFAPLVAPGRSISVTVVPGGLVSFTTRSPTYVWSSPTVVAPIALLHAEPSNLKFTSVMAPDVAKGSDTLIPAAVLSGIATAGPV